MNALLAGLILFFATHSVRIFAERWRSAQVERLGLNRWKALYSLVAIAGFVLIAWGYGSARLDPVILFDPPVWTRHLAALLTIPAFVLLVAAYVPGNAIKAWLHHPMVLGVKVWALAHLLANNTLADLLLFGGFALWAVLDFRSARQRDRAAGTVYAAGKTGATVLTLVLGTALWAVLAFWLHALLFGVRPFGG